MSLTNCSLFMFNIIGYGLVEVERETVRRRNVSDKRDQEEGNLKSSDYLIVTVGRTRFVRSVTYTKPFTTYISLKILRIKLRMFLF